MAFSLKHTMQACHVRVYLVAAGGLRSQDWPAQLEGLERKLHASKAGWKIVVGHHPPRSNGHHGNTVELLEALEPILQVDLCLQCSQASVPVSLPTLLLDLHSHNTAMTLQCGTVHAVQCTLPLIPLSRLDWTPGSAGDWSASLFCRS